MLDLVQRKEILFLREVSSLDANVGSLLGVTIS